MFYNHEVLTSRKYGIATIWLVATLGSKSTLRKINRRAIFDVNIFRACETIVAPEVPMALRLQSNLLFGVTRVYDQQCSFVLSEAQTVQNDLKRAARIVPRLEIDADATKALRPDQLLLQDDPNFMPDIAFANLAFDLELDNLGLTTDDSSQHSSLLSPHTPGSNQSSNELLPQIIIPSSQTVPVGVIGDYVQGMDDSRMGRFSGFSGGGLARYEEEEGLLDEPGFTFDIDGNLVEDNAGEVPHPIHSIDPADLTGSRRESSLLAQVRQEHEDAQQGGMNTNNEMEIDYNPPQDEFAVPDDAVPFVPRPQPGTIAQHSDPEAAYGPRSGDVQQHQESPISVEAAQTRKPRATKVLELDDEVEISGSRIKDWERDYISNMAKATAQRASLKAVSLAKKRAEYWVWTMGIGGVGGFLANTNVPSPLDIFYGDKLFAMVAGPPPTSNIRKRDHSSIDGQSNGSDRRRVRSRPGSADEMGRGIGDIDMDGGGINTAMDNEEIEIGRDAPTPLPGDIGGDPSSLMPWNRSGSQLSTGHRFSAIPFGQVSGQPSRRVSINSATPLRAGPFSRRNVSASPLIGHGLSHGNQPIFGPAGVSSSLGMGFEGVGGTLEDDVAAGDDFTALNTQEEFELFGPAADVDTQTAGQSQWIKKALDHESANFLDFVQNSIEERQTQAAAGAKEREISFESLLNPKTNSKVVAAQALLHCLTLATKSLLRVRQEQDSSDIVLALWDDHQRGTLVELQA